MLETVLERLERLEDRFGQGRRKDNSKQRSECYNCHKLGHFCTRNAQKEQQSQNAREERYSDKRAKGLAGLQKASEVPADDKGQVTSMRADESVNEPFEVVGKSRVGKGCSSRQVSIAENVKIPGQAEMLIDVYVNRVEEDDFDKEAEYLVEPNDSFAEKYKLMMASTLVDINKDTTCKVRVLNPFSHSVTSRQDAIIGKAEKIEGVCNMIVEKENPNESENLKCIRRVDVASPPDIKDMPFKLATEDEVPDHLKELFKRSTKNRTEKEKQAVAALFVKYGNTFSKHEWDIGLTHLNEHSIDTGNAQPIRQRPRRVPLAFASEEKQAIEDLLKKGVIQKSTSPWSSPIVLVRKKSGAVRPLC
ncbi:uncharacterized protein LOC132742031 [Ruditapes philippinarum]|uniref:uncharacterized protein LOC132742031 n=1 Tax=Ruditapes philippinarum TaxID=129788 RepID=UPI00295A77FE|nr:uncharacterized protein LOC132742031 [Ruditapes philippinarum]